MYQTCIVLKILTLSMGTLTNISPGCVLVATAVVTFYFVRNTIVITLCTMQNTIQNCYNIDWLMIVYIALFSALLSRLIALACGSTWVTSFIARFLNIHRSGVLTALAWLVPHETAAVSAQVLCTSYNHAPCHFMQSHICMVYMCLAVTCHLHFWQNERDLLRATAVTRGWNGYRNTLQRDHLHCSSLSVWPPTTIHPSNILHSSADNCIFCILNIQKKFQGLCIFFTSPSVWNNLPFSVQHAQTLSSYKQSRLTFSLFLTSNTSSLPQVNLGVGAWGGGGWGDVWWQILCK